MIYLFVIYSKNNIAKEPVPIEFQKFVLGNIITLGTQKPYKRSKLSEYIHQTRIKREAKKIFWMKVFKSEEQKYLAIDRNTTRNSQNKP